MNEISLPSTEQSVKKHPALKFIEWLRTNLEVLIIAFILAMTIRCFAIEVFKIPTSSMEPTLMGDIISGDRIVANKFIMLFEPIKRYDVILFKFPLDRTKNFIKRVVGLPEEELTTRNGDIYFRKTPNVPFQLARKPLKVQESIWIPWPANEDDWQMSKNVKLENNCFYLSGEIYSAEIKYTNTIRDQYDLKEGSYQVDDIKLIFKFRINSPFGKLVSQINTSHHSFILSLSPEKKKNSFSIMKNFVVTLPDVVVKFGREYLLEFINYDGLVCIKLNGKIIYQYDYTGLLPILIEPERKELYPSIINPIIIRAEESDIVLQDIQIYRDFYYTLSPLPNKSVIIPKNKYFVIGDNVGNSKDSRSWQIKRISLKNGKIIECDIDSWNLRQEYPDRIEILRKQKENKGGDIWGSSHIIPRDQIKMIEEPDDLDHKFVDYRAIFGKAFLVYWPLTRLKLIR